MGKVSFHKCGTTWEMTTPRALLPSSAMNCSVPIGERVANIGYCPACFMAWMKAAAGLCSATRTTACTDPAAILSTAAAISGDWRSMAALAARVSLCCFSALPTPSRPERPIHRIDGGVGAVIANQRKDSFFVDQVAGVAYRAPAIVGIVEGQ